MRRRLAAAGLFLVLSLVTLAVFARGQDVYRLAARVNRQYVLSREERLIRAFGDCTPAGYGYLKQVLTAYSAVEPESAKRPVIRYADFDRRVEYLFEPTRFETDPRIVVGIGLAESDMREHVIGQAVHVSGKSWHLSLASRIDVLTRIEVDLDADRGTDVTLRLYRRPKDTTPFRVLSRAEPAEGVSSPAEPGQRRVWFPASPPVSGRVLSSLEPILLQIDGNASVRTITAHGIVANLQGYRIVHRRGACFTAIRDADTRRWARLIDQLNDAHD
jgi:hypothetical protein